MVATALSRVSSHTLAARTFRATGWTADHLQHTIAALKAKHPSAQLHILQASYHTGYAPSAGTHDFDGVLDVWIEGLSWSQAQRFLRSQGWAAWHRTTAQGFTSEHIHMATIPAGLSGRPTAQQVGAAYKALGLKVGKFIDGGITSQGKVIGSSQIVDYFAHSFGLAGDHQSGADKSWFPADIAKTIYQPEDDDMTKEEMLQVLRSKEGQDAIAKAVVQSTIHGQTDKPNGRMVGASITGIYNLLLRIAKKIGA
jgi:hypothetical protein